MGNSVSHDSSAITDYQLFEYTKRTLYNITNLKLLYTNFMQTFCHFLNVNLVLTTIPQSTLLELCLNS